MWRFILAAGSAALGLTAWSSPACGSAHVTPVAVTPMWAAVGHGQAQPDTGWPVEEEGWLKEWLLDRLTIPLGPADQNIWPLGIRREQLIATVADHPGGNPCDAS
jgi:hypothetical protein